MEEFMRGLILQDVFGHIARLYPHLQPEVESPRAAEEGSETRRVLDSYGFTYHVEYHPEVGFDGILIDSTLDELEDIHARLVVEEDLKSYGFDPGLG